MHRRALLLISVGLWGFVAVGRGNAHEWRRPFVIGSAGRLDAAGDRRLPRRYVRVESAVGAYADVEIVGDPTWLLHELQLYARQAVDCEGLGKTWCRREVRQLAGSRVIALAAGLHAEMLWPAAPNVAVRVGWRRIVVTPTGTMTLDAPPAEFTAALLAEFPSRLSATLQVDREPDERWSLDEIDRLMYYADQVLDGVLAVHAHDQRNHALRFVESNLARIEELRAALSDAGRSNPAGALRPQADGPTLQLLAEQLRLVREWRTGTEGPPWCVAFRDPVPAAF